MRKTFLAAVTLAILGHSVQAGYTLTDLENIEAFVTANDFAGLISYLDENPAILSGTDPLAVEARSFKQAFSATGLSGVFDTTTAPSVDTISGLADQY